MKQELNLTIPTDQLAELIQRHVDAVLQLNETNAIFSSAPPATPLQAETLENIVIVTDLPAEKIDTHHISSAAPLPLDGTQTDAQCSKQEPEVLSPRLDLASKSDDHSHIATIHSHGQDDPFSSEDSSHRHSKSPDDPSHPTVVADASKLEIPKPGTDASPEELADFTELLRELEKIDKDCRAAKRVFEQRIQKHKLILVCLHFPHCPDPSTGFLRRGPSQYFVRVQRAVSANREK